MEINGEELDRKGLAHKAPINSEGPRGAVGAQRAAPVNATPEIPPLAGEAGRGAKHSRGKGEQLARIIVIILIAVFLGIAAITMLRGQSGSPVGMPGAPSGAPSASPGMAGASSENLNAITVSAKTIAPETIRQYISLNGDVAAQREVSVYPETTGRITRVLKAPGDSVRAWETIAYIDPSRAGAVYAVNAVTSPVAGTIISVPIDVGTTVSSTNTVIATVGNLSNLKITIYVAEKYSAFLRMGLPAEVTFTATPGESFNASVTALSPVVNNANRTVETTLSLSDRDNRIKAGMFASVRLVIQEAKDAMIVPNSAIKDYNEAKVVYIITNDKAKRVTVKIGLSNDTDSQIVEGLSMGDSVITAGSVTDGTPVRIAGAK
ncbi:MAG: efflux RND transporter periplasmic adaptor subunit [Spirochaetaceae bacterium]|jgi:multidrug efflux pump subunit AcrA (membrane-fusion protein)|nr:efflux RND transporter periplasmic adaptor subunit [Spirochaetaceae bacterium]